MFTPENLRKKGVATPLSTDTFSRFQFRGVKDRDLGFRCCRMGYRSHRVCSLVCGGKKRQRKEHTFWVPDEKNDVCRCNHGQWARTNRVADTSKTKLGTSSLGLRETENP